MTAAVAQARNQEARERNPREENIEDRALANIIYENSFGRGDVTLASGRKSDFYFDMKPSMLHPEGAHLIAKKILAELIRVDAEYVGGLEMGAVPITGAVCQLSHEKDHPVRGFFVRKTPKGHGAKKLVEGLKPDQSLKARRAVVVDDVTTTGESALKAVAALQEGGAEIVLVISIVDRGEGAVEAFEKQGIPFKYFYDANEFLSRR
jgi:orotate phosphoribosyltransferase